MQAAESRARHAPLLEARGLSKDYGDTRAPDSLDLAIAPGEVYCLLGPNGAGKTTNHQPILGFAAPSAGQALVSGLDVSAHDRETKQRLAYIPEQMMLYRNLSGLENLECFAALGVRLQRERRGGTGIRSDRVHRGMGLPDRRETVRTMVARCASVPGQPGQPRAVQQPLPYRMRDHQPRDGMLRDRAEELGDRHDPDSRPGEAAASWCLNRTRERLVG